MDGSNPPRLVLAGLSVVIAVQIGGFALLWSKDTPPPEYVYLSATTNEPSAASPTNAPVVVVSPPDEKALRQIIQIVLERELRSYIGQSASSSGDTKTVEKNTPANLQAYENIKNVVDSAIANGRWTMNDTIAALPYSDRITEDQRNILMDKIGAAINSQTMELSPNAPPQF